MKRSMKVTKCYELMIEGKLYEHKGFQSLWIIDPHSYAQDEAYGHERRNSLKPKMSMRVCLEDKCRIIFPNYKA